MKPLTNLIVKYLSNFFYFIGISILIPYFINISVPNNLFFSWLPENLLVIIAIVCVSLGFLGVYLRKGHLKSAFRTLGYLTIIPALLSAYILLFGDQLLMSFAERLRVAPIVGFSLRTVPSVWILTISYFVLAIVWFLLGSRR